MTAGLLWSCGPTAPATPPPAQPAPVVIPSAQQKPTAPPAPVETFAFVARASAATEELAYRLARRRLLVALLNDEALQTEEPFSDQLTLAVHDQAVDPFRSLSTGDGIEVEVGLRRTGIEPTLDRLRNALHEIELAQVPLPLRQSVARFRTARLESRLCQRRRDLLDQAECAAEPAASAERELALELHRVVLRPLFEGGVPMTEGRYLRPLLVAAVFRHEHDKPLPRVPLSLFLPGEAEPRPVTSDEQGRFTFEIPPGTPADARLRVELDIARLVGRNVPSLKLAPLWVQGRATSMARSALLIAGVRGTSQAVGSALQADLGSLMQEKVALSQPLAQELVRASPDEWKKRLPRIADEHGGRLDRVLFVDAESEFASRMGTHRVWFEARGRLILVDAWTGDILCHVDSAVTESGVGEARAEQAAETTLGRDLAAKLIAALAAKAR